MCRASGAGACIEYGHVPTLPDVDDLVRSGCVTGASARNWSGYGVHIELSPGLPDTARALLTDPQTSGGLLVACSAETVDEVLGIFTHDAFDRAAVIGEITDGPVHVVVQ